MKKNLKGIVAILIVIFSIYAIGQVKYWLWRSEHPQAKTWTFFIPSGRR